MINVSSKINLENGESFYLIEQFHNNKNEVRKNSNNRSFSMNFDNIRIPFCTATIILTKEGDYIGHISSQLYENQLASFCMSGIRNVELPDGLENYHEMINKQDVALLVNEKYRGQNKSRKLIYLMFCYLNSKNIINVEVNGIGNSIAWKTYLGMGALKISENKAMYYDINKLLKSEIFDFIVEKNMNNKKI